MKWENLSNIHKDGSRKGAQGEAVWRSEKRPQKDEDLTRPGCSGSDWQPLSSFLIGHFAVSGLDSFFLQRPRPVDLKHAGSLRSVVPGAGCNTFVVPDADCCTDCCTGHVKGRVQPARRKLNVLLTQPKKLCFHPSLYFCLSDGLHKNKWYNAKSKTSWWME